jgi:hypothetical protein
MEHRPIMKCLVALALTLALLQCGCISSRIAPTVISYNLAVEQAQNEMLLLNTVRAAKWQPMYLTDISKITGSIKRDLTATLTVPFGAVHRGAAANYSGAPGGTYSVNPTFDVNVLNTQDFMKGFLQPLGPDLLAYFWNQGWPPALLLHLFVLQVDEKTGNDVHSYFNIPRFNSDNADLKAFSRWVTQFVAKKPRFASCEPKDASIGPTLSPEKVVDLDALVATAAEGLSLEQVAGGGPNPRYQLKRPKKEFRIEIGSVQSSANGSASCPAEKAGAEGELGAPAMAQIRASDSARPDYQVALHLRSPEDVLYYLGQIVRLETRDQKAAQFALPKGEDRYEIAPLFVAFPQNRADASGQRYPSCKAVVTVTDAEGERYIIPAAPWPPEPFHSIQASAPDGVPLSSYVSEKLSCEPGMSVDVLAIMTQLIALHKSAKEFPTTGLVRVIGQ